MTKFTIGIQAVPASEVTAGTKTGVLVEHAFPSTFELWTYAPDWVSSTLTDVYAKHLNGRDIPDTVRRLWEMRAAQGRVFYLSCDELGEPFTAGEYLKLSYVGIGTPEEHGKADGG